MQPVCAIGLLVREPRQSFLPIRPEIPTRIRPQRLSWSESHRAGVLSAQGFSLHRKPIRQALRNYLSRQIRRGLHLMRDVMSLCPGEFGNCWFLMSSHFDLSERSRIWPCYAPRTGYKFCFSLWFSTYWLDLPAVWESNDSNMLESIIQWGTSCYDL